jgi:hypothetical protein
VLERARFHLIAVTRGSFDACAAHFSGSLGTLQINTGLTAAEHFEHPFTVGNLDRKKKFVHVLDEFSLEVVMRELDTVSDFVEYLRERERFLTSENTLVMAAGEEQLIAAYLSNMSGDKHSFLPSTGEDNTPDIVFFDETHYPEFIQSAAYSRRRAATLAGWPYSERGPEMTCSCQDRNFLSNTAMTNEHAVLEAEADFILLQSSNCSVRVAAASFASRMWVASSSSNGMAC